MLHGFAFLLPLGLAACATTTVTAVKPTGPDPRAVARVVMSAADQVKRCYRSPRLGRDARQISTRLHVRYAADGTLSGLPEVISQSSVTPANQPYASTMAQAAVAAVINCSPLKLPPELYRGGWDEFVLTFSPPSFA